MAFYQIELSFTILDITATPVFLHMKKVVLFKLLNNTILRSLDLLIKAISHVSPYLLPMFLFNVVVPVEWSLPYISTTAPALFFSLIRL